MALYLVDTCVWRDYVENRNNGAYRLGDDAERFFLQSIIQNSEILMPDAVYLELSNTYLDEEIRNLSLILEAIGTIRMVKSTTKQLKEAKQISDKRKLPLIDCLLAVIARDSDAIVVTQDHHFKRLADIAKSIRP